ncbi:MAG: DUF4136 domain-containing protein [Burkholderiaceae bacterium]
MLKFFATAATAFALSGCAGIGALNSEVSTYGSWPAERKPSTYAFERLPSQQERADEQKLVEDAARGALAAAGFTPAATTGEAQVTVQVGARVGNYDRWPYADPFWRNVSVGYSLGYHRGFGRGRWGLGLGAGYGGWAGGPGPVGYEREVALLMRDQKTGQLLYEARASNNGASSAINPLLPAMFAAALRDFPAGGPNPRSVTVELSKQ